MSLSKNKLFFAFEVQAFS